MKLYLTSVAARTLDKLLPFLEKSPKDLKVAFIPTAGDIYEEKPWMEADRNKLIELGFQVIDIDIKSKNKSVLQKELSSFDIIFVAGGNTSYLLEKAQECGFLEVVKNLVKNNVVYVGSSAGSLLAGPNIEMDKIYDIKERFGKKLISYEGLGLVDFVTLPHTDNPKYALYIEKIHRLYGDKYNLINLKDNQAILVQDNNWQMLEA